MRVGVDANILLRALLNDDPVHSEAARNFLSNLGAEKSGYVSTSALLETFWVLRSRYRIPPATLHQTLHELLTIGHIEVEDFEAVARALVLYRDRRADFPDALLAERNLVAGCAHTLTFDRDAVAAIPSMTLLA